MLHFRPRVKNNETVLVNDLQNLTGEESQDVVVQTNNGVSWILKECMLMVMLITILRQVRFLLN